LTVETCRQRRETARILRSLALALALCLVVTSGWDQDSLVTAVKASYLSKFAPFVVWPAGPPGPGTFAICVVGKDPFGGVLDRAVSGQTIVGRPAAVLRLATIQANSPCQIAFLGGSPAQGVKDALRALRGAPVLTVTDGGAPRGIIDLAMVDGRVRFRVDNQAAADSGLTISSKLLRLALSVNSGRNEQGTDRSKRAAKDTT
jgi:hypothetical protein